MFQKDRFFYEGLQNERDSDLSNSLVDLPRGCCSVRTHTIYFNLDKNRTNCLLPSLTIGRHIKATCCTVTSRFFTQRFIPLFKLKCIENCFPLLCSVFQSSPMTMTHYLLLLLTPRQEKPMMELTGV